MLQPSCFSSIYMEQECCFVSKLAHPSRIPHLFFVSVLLILKSMNYSQRIPYIFKTFLLNKTAYLILPLSPPPLAYPQWGIMIWIVEDDRFQAALYIWLHPPPCFLSSLFPGLTLRTTSAQQLCIFIVCYITSTSVIAVSKVFQLSKPEKESKRLNKTQEFSRQSKKSANN